jgi:TetR/AcrR family transcriptional regulator, regulator of cefoperazone and chloramphenicol sensitivity
MERADFIPTSPRERILAATIEIIEQVGPNKLTTRSIAAAADVNIAAINYYFTSKEALLEAALATSWDHAAEHLRDYLSTEPWDPRVALSGIAGFLFEGGFRFPTVMKTNFFDGEGRVRAHIATAITALSGELEGRLASALNRPADIQLRIRVNAFLSALFFPPLASASLFRFDDEAERGEYVRVLVNDLLTSLGVVESGSSV